MADDRNAMRTRQLGELAGLRRTAGFLRWMVTTPLESGLDPETINRMAADVQAAADSLAVRLDLPIEGPLPEGGELLAWAAVDIERWLKWHRDRYVDPIDEATAERTGEWWVVDSLLDDLRDHLATGMSLHRECGPTVEPGTPDRWTP